MKAGISILTVAITGIIYWVNHNLGVLFWVLLGLTLFDILYGVVMDAMKLKSEKFSWIKSVRGFAVLGVPVLIANFHNGISTSTIHSGLQIVFAVLILAQLQFVVPNIIGIIKYITGKILGRKNPLTQQVDKMSAEEIQKLLGYLDAKISKTGVTPPSTTSQTHDALSSTMTERK